MPYYRIYLLNRTNRVWLTDHSAFSRAAELVDNRHAAEVWDSNRLVGTLAAAGLRSAAPALPASFHRNSPTTGIE